MKKSLLTIAVLGMSTCAFAATNGEVGARVSTLGLGLEYSFPANEQFDVGINANYFNYNNTFEEDDLKLDVNARLLTIGAVGYYYPLDNGFNVNGGLYYNGNRVSAEVRPSGSARTYTFNDVTYTSDDVKDGKSSVDFNKIAPYVGVGWKSGDRNSEGLAFNANLGVMFHGTPNVQLSASCTGSLARPNDSISKAACDELQRNINVERKKFQDDTEAYKFYPVASVGFVYRF